MKEKKYFADETDLKIFPGVKALDNVDFNVRYGEVHCLIEERRRKVYFNEDSFRSL